MAPKKHHDDPPQVDQSVTAWRGFQTAFIGLATTLLIYTASHIGEPSGIERRLAEIEAQVRATNAKVDAFIDGFNTRQTGRK